MHSLKPPRRQFSLSAQSLLALFLFAGVAQPGSVLTTPSLVQGPTVMDAAGNLYFFQAGQVTPGAAQTQPGGGQCLTGNGFFSGLGPCPDAYAGKIDPGGRLVFGTYLGGSTADAVTALAVDRDGNVFLTGSTGGSFPTTANAVNPASIIAKTFAAKLSSDGSRVLYSTYLTVEMASTSAIAVDSLGNAFIAGQSNGGHVLVLKLNATGTAVLYSAGLAGSAQDSVSALISDSAGSVTLAGQTTSPDFPVTLGAFQTRLAGSQNIFAARLDAVGGVVFATYLGGSGTDAAAAIQTDAANNVYVTGRTTSLDFPTTPNSFEPTAVVPLWNDAGPGGFTAKLSADGSKLVWSTYVMSADHPLTGNAGSRFLGATLLEVTPSGEAYVAGVAGPGFPVTSSAPQICFDGRQSPSTYSGTGSADAFILHLNSRGALADATYIGRGVLYTLGLAVSLDGTVTLISNDSSFRSNVRSEFRFGGTAPACVSPAPLNSATMSTIPYSANGPAILPGELVTLTGYGMGPENGLATNGLPMSGGVQVFFDSQPAPLLYVQSRQINVQAPLELSGKSNTVITVVYNQAVIGVLNAGIAAYGFPGIFRLHPGAGNDAAAVNEDASVNSAVNPAARGSTVSIWGTGFGVMEPTCQTGGLNAPGPSALASGLGVAIVEATPPGFALRSTPVLYAGGAPGLLCGVVQINFRVPVDIPQGAYTFRASSTVALPSGGLSGVAGTSASRIWVK